MHARVQRNCCRERVARFIFIQLHAAAGEGKSKSEVD